MSWSRKKSLERIQQFKESVPEGNIDVRNFSKELLIERRKVVSANKATDGRDEDLIFNVRPSEAVLVDGVHVYVQLMDYHDMLIDKVFGYETEASHARLLGMLHLHYIACDRIAEEFEAQRVDYHGPRMHAVIVSPAGPDGVKERARKALAFAHMLQRTLKAAAAQIGDGSLATRVRIGIDSGRAVAVNSGRASEPEPLFLGSPANYAAKLADGNEEGIFISNNVRRDLGMPLITNDIYSQRAANISGSVTDAALIQAGTDALPIGEAALDRAVKKVLTSPELGSYDAVTSFTFHHREPPLSTLKFSELSPSYSVRMPLASIFADIDGFTRYVDEAIANARVAEMVSNLHVLRMEANATLRDDFGGRKVRFIGDCIHGVIAEGTSVETDKGKTVRSAVRAAGGFRSSFELCQEMLPNIANLGLAIGIELGATPMTRLGIRGDRSVRCSSSRAVSMSEGLQANCNGNETSLGPAGLAAAPADIKRLFDDMGKAQGLDYDAVEQQVAAPSIISSGSVTRVGQPHAK
ncbi:MAG: guanylate cyclase [Proteobacteria bacterium]|nr:guanylate cyclase [Pseudomonadota bacterium]